MCDTNITFFSLFFISVIFQQSYENNTELNRVGENEIRLMLWDTAGQEEFDALTKAYYRGAQGCVVAFSTTDKASFDAVEKWKKKVEFECGDIPMALVQNKADLLEQRTMTSDDVDRLARRLQMRLFLTSAKNNVNIDDVFYFLAKSYCNSLDEDAYEEPLSLKMNQESLNYSLLPPTINPLFSGNYTTSKDKKLLKKSSKSNKSNSKNKSSKLFQLPSAQYQAVSERNAIGAGGGLDLSQASHGNPLLRHFRYERRFQLIPGSNGRPGGHHGTPTILLHHPPWQPYYGTPNAYSQQQQRQHHHRRSKRRSSSKTCWIL